MSAQADNPPVTSRVNGVLPWQYHVPLARNFSTTFADCVGVPYAMVISACTGFGILRPDSYRLPPDWVTPSRDQNSC